MNTFEKYFLMNEEDVIKYVRKKTDFFKETQPLLNNCSLICGLDGNKMGKSFNNDIKISDTEEVTSKKVMTAKKC